MILDEPTYPAGRRVDLAGRATRYELEILLDGAMRVRIDFHAGQVTVNQRDEAREFARLKTPNGFVGYECAIVFLVGLQTIDIVLLII